MSSTTIAAPDLMTPSGAIVKFNTDAYPLAMIFAAMEKSLWVTRELRSNTPIPVRFTYKGTTVTVDYRSRPADIFVALHMAIENGHKYVNAHPEETCKLPLERPSTVGILKSFEGLYFKLADATTDEELQYALEQAVRTLNFKNGLFGSRIFISVRNFKFTVSCSSDPDTLFEAFEDYYFATETVRIQPSGGVTLD